MNIFITIDTEWDRKKNKTSNITVKNLEKIEQFQKLCNKFNIKPIFFCTYEVLENNNFTNFIKEYVENNNVEIGAHLHPWSTPPFPYGETIQEIINTSFPHEYPLDVFYSKLKSLTEKIEQKFKIKPLSYRAGRFGFVKEHIPYLSKLGYKIDSSITPYISHKNSRGWKELGIDFSKYKDLNPKKLFFQESSIVEIPITIIPPENILVRALKNILNKRPIPRWFRISPGTKISDLINIINYAKANNINFLVFIMHSNEFHHETNPYFTTVEEQRELFKLLEGFFQKIKNLNLKSITFKDYIDKF